MPLAGQLADDVVRTLCAIVVADDYAGPFLRQHAHRGRADSARTAGDDGDLALQLLLISHLHSPIPVTRPRSTVRSIASPLSSDLTPESACSAPASLRSNPAAVPRTPLHSG